MSGALCGDVISRGIVALGRQRLDGSTSIIFKCSSVDAVSDTMAMANAGLVQATGRPLPSVLPPPAM